MARDEMYCTQTEPSLQFTPASACALDKTALRRDQESGELPVERGRLSLCDSKEAASCMVHFRRYQGFDDQCGQDPWVFQGKCLKNKAGTHFSAEVCAEEDTLFAHIPQ